MLTFRPLRCVIAQITQNRKCNAKGWERVTARHYISRQSTMVQKSHGTMGSQRLEGPGGLSEARPGSERRPLPPVGGQFRQPDRIPSLRLSASAWASSLGRLRNCANRMTGLRERALCSAILCLLYFGDVSAFSINSPTLSHQLRLGSTSRIPSTCLHVPCTRTIKMTAEGVCSAAI